MMDGAGRMRRLVDVTLPHIKELVVLVLILHTFIRFRNGKDPPHPRWGMHHPGPPRVPGGVSHGNYGRASTMALLLLLIALAITYAFATVSEVEF